LRRGVVGSEKGEGGRERRIVGDQEEVWGAGNADLIGGGAVV